jgi:hypothetical protein
MFLTKFDEFNFEIQCGGNLPILCMKAPKTSSVSNPDMNDITFGFDGAFLWLWVLLMVLVLTGSKQRY